MFRIKNNVLLILLFICTNCIGQNNRIHSKYYVKENAVLLRWVPASKELFNIATKNGYKITRYLKENNALSSPAVLADKIIPYASHDSASWKKLIKKNAKAAFVFHSLYDIEPSNNITPKETEEQKSMLYGLMMLSCDFDADIAKACGLFLKDSTVSANTIYSYKIEINNVPASMKITPSIIEVNSGVLSVNPEINNLTGKFKNKTVNLKWKATDFTGDYGGYNIERSLDNIEFKKINNSPVILLTSQYEKKKEHITYTDTLPNTKVKYHYRIKGINHFGEESDPSNVISGIGHEELHSTPFFDSLKIIKNRKVFLHWQMSDPKENYSPKEYILMRSEKDNGPYSVIYKSPTEFTFIDEIPLQSNYYRIGAITHGNDTLFSFSKLALIADTIPPVAPTNVQAKVDQKGNVQIIWDKNPENDVQGYKIYKANALSEEFVQMNDEFAKTTFYRDKLNLKTLSKKIYYSVVATDNNFNSSELSKPIEVKRPDTIPPVAAIIKDLHILQNGIKISWIPSSSDDVTRHILYHEDEKSSSVNKIKVWGPSDSATSFTDTIVEFGSGYRYKIIAMDADSNISISNNPYMFFETGFRKKIININQNVDRSKKTITLNWNYPEKEIEKFIIYRAKLKEPLTIIKTMTSTSASFEDNTLNIGNTYEYRIKAVYNNGAESIISDAIIAEF